MPSRLNAVADTKYTGVSFVRKKRRISDTPRSGPCVLTPTIPFPGSPDRRAAERSSLAPPPALERR
jgi:hypothetical protein